MVRWPETVPSWDDSLSSLSPGTRCSRKSFTVLQYRSPPESQVFICIPLGKSTKRHCLLWAAAFAYSNCMWNAGTISSCKPDRKRIGCLIWKQKWQHSKHEINCIYKQQKSNNFIFWWGGVGWWNMKMHPDVFSNYTIMYRIMIFSTMFQFVGNCTFCLTTVNFSC